jgi:hypothetical protein
MTAMNVSHYVDRVASAHCVSLRRLRKTKNEIGNQLDALDANRAERSLSENEQYAALNADYESLSDRIWDLEDALLERPINSRCAVVTKLKIILDRDRHWADFNTSDQIDTIISQVKDWQRREPVMWP